MKERVLAKVIDQLGRLMLENEGCFWVSAGGGTVNVASGTIARMLAMDFEQVREAVWEALQGVFQDCFSSSQSRDWDELDIDIRDLVLTAISTVRLQQSS